jgi:transaldolase
MNPTNPLQQLQEYGQSIWLDFIERRFLNDGSLQQLIREDGVTGVTSNPAIFHAAISHAQEYQQAITRLAKQGLSNAAIYEHITIDDIVQATEQFHPTYVLTKGGDGFVSIEVSPLLAHDADATVQAAMRLWNLIHQPNVMIKVPGTLEGLKAVRRLIAEGFNVNVTLLFSPHRYMLAAEAYFAGLEDRLANGKPLHPVNSVASFFLSRIDTKVDAQLDSLARGDDKNQAQLAQSLRGHTAIAYAGMAYHRFMDLYDTPRWRQLAEQGARKQRLLWASTGAKDPLANPLKYVENVIAAETVNTLPLPTLELYRRNGNPGARLVDRLHEAGEILHRLNNLKIKLTEIELQLENEGIQKFIEPYQNSLAIIDSLRSRVHSPTLQ